MPIGDRVEVNVGPDKDITIHRRLKDQKTSNVVVRQYKRRLDDQFVLYYDLVDYDETFFFEEEIVSGKPVVAKTEVERQFDANVVLWGPDGKPKGWDSQEPGAYVDLHDVPGRVERVDQQHVKYFLDLQPGKKQLVSYSVTYKRRKVGPELNTERKREPWRRRQIVCRARGIVESSKARRRPVRGRNRKCTAQLIIRNFFSCFPSSRCGSRLGAVGGFAKGRASWTRSCEKTSALSWRDADIARAHYRVQLLHGHKPLRPAPKTTRRRRPTPSGRNTSAPTHRLPPTRPRVRDLLRKYLDERVLFYKAYHEQDRQQINVRTAQLQTELWSAIRAPAEGRSNPRDGPGCFGHERCTELAGIHSGCVLESNPICGLGPDGSNRHRLQLAGWLWFAKHQGGITVASDSTVDRLRRVHADSGHRLPAPRCYSSQSAKSDQPS